MTVLSSVTIFLLLYTGCLCHPLGVSQTSEKRNQTFAKESNEKKGTIRIAGPWHSDRALDKNIDPAEDAYIKKIISSNEGLNYNKDMAEAGDMFDENGLEDFYDKDATVTYELHGHEIPVHLKQKEPRVENIKQNQPLRNVSTEKETKDKRGTIRISGPWHSDSALDRNIDPGEDSYVKKVISSNEGINFNKDMAEAGEMFDVNGIEDFYDKNAMVTYELNGHEIPVHLKQKYTPQTKSLFPEYNRDNTATAGAMTKSVPESFPSNTGINCQTPSSCSAATTDTPDNKITVAQAQQMLKGDKNLLLRNLLQLHSNQYGENHANSNSLQQKGMEPKVSENKVSDTKMSDNKELIEKAYEDFKLPWKFSDSAGHINANENGETKNLKSEEKDDSFVNKFRNNNGPPNIATNENHSVLPDAINSDHQSIPDLTDSQNHQIPSNNPSIQQSLPTDQRKISNFEKETGHISTLPSLEELHSMEGGSHDSLIKQFDHENNLISSQDPEVQALLHKESNQLITPSKPESDFQHQQSSSVPSETPSALPLQTANALIERLKESNHLDPSLLNMPLNDFIRPGGTDKNMPLSRESTAFDKPSAQASLERNPIVPSDTPGANVINAMASLGEGDGDKGKAKVRILSLLGELTDKLKGVEAVVSAQNKAAVENLHETPATEPPTVDAQQKSSFTSHEYEAKQPPFHDFPHTDLREDASDVHNNAMHHTDLNMNSPNIISGIHQAAVDAITSASTSKSSLDAQERASLHNSNSPEKDHLTLEQQFANSRIPDTDTRQLPTVEKSNYHPNLEKSEFSDELKTDENNAGASSASARPTISKMLLAAEKEKQIHDQIQRLRDMDKPFIMNTAAIDYDPLHKSDNEEEDHSLASLSPEFKQYDDNNRNGDERGRITKYRHPKEEHVDFDLLKAKAMHSFDSIRGKDEHSFDNIRGKDEHSIDNFHGKDKHSFNSFDNKDEHSFDSIRGKDEVNIEHHDRPKSEFERADDKKEYLRHEDSEKYRNDFIKPEKVMHDKDFPREDHDKLHVSDTKPSDKSNGIHNQDLSPSIRGDDKLLEGFKSMETQRDKDASRDKESTSDMEGSHNKEMSRDMEASHNKETSRDNAAREMETPHVKETSRYSESLHDRETSHDIEVSRDKKIGQRDEEKEKENNFMNQNKESHDASNDHADHVDHEEHADHADHTDMKEAFAKADKTPLHDDIKDKEREREENFFTHYDDKKDTSTKYVSNRMTEHSRFNTKEEEDHEKREEQNKVKNLLLQSFSGMENGEGNHLETNESPKSETSGFHHSDDVHSSLMDDVQQKPTTDNHKSSDIHNEDEKEKSKTSAEDGKTKSSDSQTNLTPGIPSSEEESRKNDHDSSTTNDHLIGKDRERTYTPKKSIFIDEAEYPDYNEVKDAALFETNFIRKQYHARKMDWSDRLSDKAQQLAERIAKSITTDQNTNKLLEQYKSAGQNVALVKLDATNVGKEAVDDWSKEAKQFDFKSPLVTKKNSDFVQMAWKASSEFGMGVSKTKTGNEWVVTAFYDTPYIDRFQDLRSNLQPDAPIEDPYGDM